MKKTVSATLIGLLCLSTFSILIPYTKAYRISGPTTSLSTYEGYLEAVVRATVTGYHFEEGTMRLEIYLPVELSYIEGSFTVNRRPTTPSVDPDVISYTIGQLNYSIQFDFRVTSAYDEDQDVFITVSGRYFDEFGNEYGISATVFGFTICAARYHSYSEIEAGLRSLESSGIAKVQSIGVTHEGRDIWAIKISDYPHIDDAFEPDLLFVGLHHAREWISAEVPYYLAVNLVQRYSTDSFVRTLVGNSEIWIVPVVNPDGLEYSREYADVYDPEIPGLGRYWRKNRRVNDDDTHGVDLDRNYDYQWGQDLEGGIDDGSPVPVDYTYWGPSPFSEPETQAIRDLISHPNRDFQLAVSYHSYSQLILYPWGYTHEPAPDSNVLSDIAAEMSSLIYNVHGETYTPQQASDLYLVSGDLADWVYATWEIPALSIELRPESADPWWSGFDLPESEILDTCEENWAAALYLIRYTLFPEVADIFVEAAGESDGHFHITFDAGAIKGGSVNSWGIISMTNIASYGITLIDDRILDLHGELQDPHLEGHLFLWIDPDGEIIECAIDIGPYAAPAYVDIKPGSWPNPLNAKHKGVLPIAICGTDDFDVTTINPDTIQLTIEGFGTGVSPLRWSYEDVATPYMGETCSGHDCGADDYLDLTFKFKTQEVIETLGLDISSDREVVILILTGNLKEEHGGMPIQGQDCVVILHS